MTRRTALAAIATGLSARELPPSKFGQAARDKLSATIDAAGFRGQIDAATVNHLLRLEHYSMDELMLNLLPLARMGSHAPLSDFHVGAVIEGSSNSLYFGANIEVPGQVLGLAVHGEQAAIANAYMHAETGVTSLAVTAAPCGHCRQFLNEMVPDGSLRILFAGASPTTLAALLPMAFGPSDLGRKQGALPIHETRLSLAEASPDKLVESALEAARRSYSPYTRSPSGVALITASARVLAGSYIENVAFNPSLSPLQTALAGLFAAGEKATGIVRVVLVEVEGARISQKDSTQATLAALAPAARLEVLRVKPAA